MSGTQALKAAATGQVPADKATNPYVQLSHQLETSRGEFAKLVGGAQNAEKFIRVVKNAVLANPELMSVSRGSLMGACMRAAQDGLMPDGREAVLNIYNVKASRRGEPDRYERRAQYLPMVGGMVKKLYESGDVTYVDAVAVYAKDRFKYQRGDEPRIEHEPTGEADPGDIIAAYAVVKLKNGEVKREVMWRRDIDKVRGASKAKDGPWKDWFGEMSIKSVLKRIYKQLPHADAFEAMARYDNEATGLEEHAAPTPADVVQGALGNDPSPVLEPSAEEIARRDELHDEAVKGAAKSAFGMSSDDVDRVRAAVGEDLSMDPVPPAAVTEEKLRTAKSIEMLDVQADWIRYYRDEAVKLHLTEVFEQRRKELMP